MKLTEDEVVGILKLVEQSTFDELHLETGELKLVVRKQGCGTAVVEGDLPPAGQAAAPSSASRVLPGQAAGSKVVGPGADKGKKAEAARGQDGLVPIKAPLLGTVYRRPSPEAPPYVDMGSFVKEDDTVCLIEVMKVFTAVKAGVRGHITEVLIETNEMVEYGQPLFMVKPGTAEP
jgi:acetyl-CoA carboxylase biotin carboxyl carrier protein